jgi:hypothetical protein
MPGGIFENLVALVLGGILLVLGGHAHILGGAAGKGQARRGMLHAGWYTDGSNCRLATNTGQWVWAQGSLFHDYYHSIEFA